MTGDGETGDEEMGRLGDWEMGRWGGVFLIYPSGLLSGSSKAAMVHFFHLPPPLLLSLPAITSYSMKCVFTVFLLVLLWNCRSGVKSPPFGAEISILFVGNSLTYANDLPELVKEYALEKGCEARTRQLAFPDYALEDHWNDGKLQEMIRTGEFDFVVVQQGPSSQEEGRRMLLEYGMKIKQACERSGSRLAFFMVWPARRHFHNFDGAIRNYSDAASHTNAILCPVGRVWKAHFDSTGDFSYYGADGFHPSPAGSRAAAKIILDSLLK